MGLSGLEIYKLLPKKNCGSGSAHLLGLRHAAGLRQGISRCLPHVSDEARAALMRPQRLPSS